MKTILILVLALALFCSAATYKDKNFSYQSLSFAKDGDVFEGCNITQTKAHTAIGGSAKNLRFVKCNLKNCDVPAGAIIDGASLVCYADIVEKTTEQLAIEAKAAELESQTLDSFRGDIKAAISKESSVLTATSEKIKQAVVTSASAVGVK